MSAFAIGEYYLVNMFTIEEILEEFVEAGQLAYQPWYDPWWHWHKYRGRIESRKTDLWYKRGQKEWRLRNKEHKKQYNKVWMRQWRANNIEESRRRNREAEQRRREKRRNASI